jgi:hypothetical protein
MKEEFEIRTMGFGELAQLYNPNIKPECASNTLRIWINKCPDLVIELRNSGHKKYSKLLTPRQVKAIIDHLGFP